MQKQQQDMNGRIKLGMSQSPLAVTAVSDTFILIPKQSVHKSVCWGLVCELEVLEVVWPVTAAPWVFQAMQDTAGCSSSGCKSHHEVLREQLHAGCCICIRW